MSLTLLKLTGNAAGFECVISFKFSGVKFLDRLITASPITKGLKHKISHGDKTIHKSPNLLIVS